MRSNPIFEYEENSPKVSVIVPVYNAEKYLKECLDSLVNQKLKDIEIICVDDGSNDNSLKILKKYQRKDSRIKVIEQEKKGAGAARNAALKIARGDYLSFVDSDDYVEPDYLNLMYNKLLTDRAEICVCRVRRKNIKKNTLFEDDKLLNFSLIPNKVFSYRDITENFFQFTNSVSWNKMIKKNLIIKYKLSFQEIERCNDCFFIYAILVAANRITTIDKVLYTQRINHDTNLHSSLYKSPLCFIDAFSKLYEWLINLRMYDTLKNTFIIALIKISDYHANRCKKYKNIYITVFNRIKEEFKKYKVKNYIEKYDFNIKIIAKKFLFSSAEKEYEKLQKNNVKKPRLNGSNN